MASTYSSNLALELIGNEDQAGSWGNTTNRNLGTLIEQAISGYVTQAVTAGIDTVLAMPNGSNAVARNMTIELTGTGGANTNLVIPANRKLYFIYNNTSAGQVTVKVSGQTGVSIPNGRKMLLVCNGTDAVPAINYFPNLTIAGVTTDSLDVNGPTTLDTVDISGTATFSGLTAGQFLILDGSKNAVSKTVSASRGAGWATTLGGAIVAPLSQTVEIASKSQITSIVILTEALVGSCVIDLWKAAKPTIPTSLNSICGTNKPTITNGTNLFSTDFTGWSSTTFNPGDLLTFRLQSSSFFSKVTIYITLQDII